tara:strand:+ start:2886 stop:7997 length:5112 start_codon:yes stop_codon:yes gene_type:complete
MAEYLVTVKDSSCLDEFYADMEFRGYTRTIRRPLSRSTGYELTEEEVSIVKRDSRVLAVELRNPPGVEIIKEGSVNYEPYSLLGQFDKDSTTSSGQSEFYQWGHLSTAGTTAQRRYGDTPGTVNASTWNTGNVQDRVDVFNDGKHVDIVIIDSAVGYDHADWISEETGQSRFVQYDWYAKHNAEVIGGLDTDGFASPGNNYVYGTVAQCGANSYHGAHVMGTAGGRHFGWAREANLYSISIFSDVTAQTTMVTELAYDYVRAFHRNKPINPVTGFKNPTIVNMSYSSSYNLEETYPDGVSSGDIYGVYFKGELYDDGVTPWNQAVGGTVPVGMKGLFSTWNMTNITRQFGIRGNRFPYYTAANSADVEDAIADGIVMVRAAGNDGQARSGDYHKSGGSIYTRDSNMWYDTVYLNNGYGYPAHNISNPYSPGIIQVGAINRTVNYNSSPVPNFPYGSIPVWWSNRSIDTHVWAPGVVIASVWPAAEPGGFEDTKFGYGGDNHFAAISGTSMASPQVTGVLACYATGKERFNSADAHRYLDKTCNKTDMFVDGWARNYPSTRMTCPISVSADPTNLTWGGQDRQKNHSGASASEYIRIEELDTINFTLPTDGTGHKWRLVKGNSLGITDTDIDNPTKYPHTIVATESAAVVGQQLYASTGTHLWTCPAGVTKVSVVCVGAGGNDGSTGGDGGGGLGWKNDIPVTPGQQYTVKVGAQIAGGNGEDSYFIDTATVKGGGGFVGTNFVGGSGGNYTGDGGGDGGDGGAPNSNRGAGGGAGGYSGKGGNGGDGVASGASAGTDGQGGGGGGGAGASWEGGAGGGVGMDGEGADGAGASTYQGTAAQAYGHCGLGGSGGLPTTYAAFPSLGYGSGGGGGNGIAGRHGAVRIIWGPGRAFPSTATADQSAGGGGALSWTPQYGDVGYYYLVCGCHMLPSHNGVPNEHSLDRQILVVVDPSFCMDDAMAAGGSSANMLASKNTRPDTGFMTEWCHEKGHRWGLGRTGYEVEHRGNRKNRALVGGGEHIWPRIPTLNRGIPQATYYTTTITHPDGSDFKVYGHANDSEGNLYVVGSIHVAQTTPGTGIDGVIYKLDKAGNVVKSVQYNPSTNSNSCHFNAVVIDDDDYIYVHATSSVVIKFNTDLVEQWQTQTLHGNGYGNISQDNIDNGGSIMQTSSSIVIAGSGYSGWHVHTVNKSNGQATASTYGSASSTMFYGANVTGGQLYFCGRHSAGHPSDYFWAIAGSSGTSSSYQFYNVGTNAVARCIVRDTTNNRTYIAGDMGGYATIMRFDSYNTTTTNQGSVWWKESTSTSDIMDIALDRDHNPVFVNGGNVTKIDPNGNVLWTKSTGGNNANKIRIDSDNNMWITCNNNSSTINVIKVPASGVGLTTITNLTLNNRSYQHQDYGQITTGFAPGASNGMNMWGNISSNSAGGSFSNFTPSHSPTTVSAPGELGYEAAGDAIFTTTGQQNWICPDGVYEVSVVCVGGGGRGAVQEFSTAGGAGGGGGLGFKNNISVTPGQTYTVKVGASGGDSWFINNTTVKGGAGESAEQSGTSSFTGGAGGNFTGDGGGLGGQGGNSDGTDGAGGGGAGGYDASGGAGAQGYVQGGNDGGVGQGGGGGGGSNGYHNGSPGHGGQGGGVGLYGKGLDGVGGTGNTQSMGVAGGDGSAQTGNAYGGGGHGANNNNYGQGTQGAVRIMWGAGRSFPFNAAELT